MNTDKRGSLRNVLLCPFWEGHGKQIQHLPLPFRKKVYSVSTRKSAFICVHPRPLIAFDGFMRLLRSLCVPTPRTTDRRGVEYAWPFLVWTIDPPH